MRPEEELEVELELLALPEELEELDKEPLAAPSGPVQAVRAKAINKLKVGTRFGRINRLLRNEAAIVPSAGVGRL